MPQEYGDSNGFQAGLDVQGVRARAGASSRVCRLNTTINSPAQDEHPDERASRTARALPEHVDVWDAGQLDDQRRHVDLYTGTQQSVNTFYAQLEQMTGLCEPYQLAKEWASTSTDPDARAGARRSPGVTDISPLEMAEAYATFAARGEHCDSPPVTAIRDRNGNVLKDYPEQLHSRCMKPAEADAVNDILQGRHRPAASASASRSTSRPPARPAPSRTARRCGSSATRRTWRPPR